jgi:hypothetical protein
MNQFKNIGAFRKNSLELNSGGSILRHPMEFSYMLVGEGGGEGVLSLIVDCVDAMTDLGAMLGLVRRFSGEFRDPYTLRTLYVS